jgi:putative transposase
LTALYCRKNKGLQIGAFVIMSNHIHTIWTAINANLSDIIRDFKSFTSKAICKSIAEEPESRKEWLLHMFEFYGRRTIANDLYKVWTSNNHPEEIFGEDFLKTKLIYTHENPVRAGLVHDPVD